LGAPDPRDIAALVALVEQDRLAEAESAARSLLGRHPDAGILWKVLAVALARQGRQAIPELRRAAELLPGDAEAHQNLGAALHDLGQWEPALASLQHSLALRGDNPAVLIDAANALRGLRRPSEAVPLYEQALRLDPALAEAHNNLGNALSDLRRHRESADSYRRALAARPDDAEILCNLGLAHAALGEGDAAFACYERVLQRQPQHGGALVNLGRLLRDLGRANEALVMFRRALEDRPDSSPDAFEARYFLGLALFDLRRTSEAIEAFRAALRCRPDSAATQIRLAEAMRQQHQPEEAEAHCEAALALDPVSAEALALRGELHADRGRFEAAESYFQRALAADPSFAPAYFSIATHRRMGAADDGWRTGATALLARPLPLSQQVSLRYALGKYFDDLGQYDEAFAHYRQANELSQRQGKPYRAGELAQRVSGILAHFDGGRIAELARFGSNATQPVFVVGMPRSGTSLVEQILASHPAVVGAGEITFWNLAFNRYERALAEGTAPAALLAEFARDYQALLPPVAAEVTRIVDKMPANFWYLGLVHAVFPRARIIHMRRDPRDTCLSIYFQNFFNAEPYANDLAHLTHYYGEYLKVMHGWRERLPAATLLELSYEALVAEPERWTRRLLEFLEIPWDSRCLEFHRTDRVVITASKWQVRQKISTSSIGRWRHYARHLGPLETLG
jgi:tetratricopeptide (TPR) repeat protein